MKKITLKIIVALAGAFFLVTLIPRIVFRVIDLPPTREILDSPLFIWGIFLSTAVALFLFAFAMNAIIIKRVMKLNQAMTKVAKGDYYVRLPANGKDEISDLTNNFNAMVGELQGNEYLSKEFIRDFSHEFNTPVSAIKGYADLISEGNISQAEIEEYSKIIALESARLATLSRSVLKLSSLDSKSLIKCEDHFNVAEQIRTVIQSMQLVWEGKGLEFNLDMEDLYILSNKELTYQIWLNLIDNAVRYSPSHGVIDIHLSKRAAMVHFEITDHGSGIAEQDKAKIFHLFFVAEKARNQNSSGIGLAFSKKIIDKMNGTISFESIPDSYTTFSVDLPYLENDARLQ